MQVWHFPHISIQADCRPSSCLREFSPPLGAWEPWHTTSSTSTSWRPWRGVKASKGPCQRMEGFACWNNFISKFSREEVIKTWKLSGMFLQWKRKHLLRMVVFAYCDGENYLDTKISKFLNLLDIISIINEDSLPLINLWPIQKSAHKLAK